MSLRKIEARFMADGDTGDVRSVEVFGHVLTESFSTIEVDDFVFGKLSGNPHIDVKGGPLDLDNSGEPGGSLTVAVIKERLTDLGVEFPARAAKGELQAMLSDAEAAHEAADAEFAELDEPAEAPEDEA